MAVTLKKVRSKRYSVENITNADNANEIALLANIPAQAESMLPNLEQVVGGICIRVNTKKSEYI